MIMDNLPFIVLFAFLSLFYFIIGFLTTRHVKNTQDYFLAGRTLGIIPVTFTLIATQIGGGMILGTAEKAYTMGFLGICYSISMSLGFFLLSCGISSRLQSFQISTTADIFEKYFGSPVLKKCAALLSICTMSGLFLGQIIASRSLLYGIGITQEWLIISLWMLILLYTVAGGLKAVVYTDIAQTLVVLVTFVSLFLYQFLKEQSNFFGFQSLLEIQKKFTESIDYQHAIPVLFLPALFALFEQDLAQRFFASRSPFVARISAFLAAISLLSFAFIPTYFGVKANLLNLTIEAGANPLLPMLLSFAPYAAYLLAICALMAAISSTADSLLCAISSELVEGLQLYGPKNMSPLKFARLATLLIGGGAFLLSYIVPLNIIDILVESYALSVSCILVPFLACIISTHQSKSAGIYSMLFGFVGFGLFRFIPGLWYRDILAIGLSFIGYVIGQTIHKRPYSIYST